MFDPNAMPESKEQSGGFTLLPKGGYRVLIADVSFKHKTGDVNTNWFNLRFDIVPYQGAGEYELAGRRIYNNYTWENQNATAREIGHGQLADMMFAVGAGAFNHPSDLSAMLMNRELYLDIYHGKRKDTGADETRIGGYWSIAGKQRKANQKPIPAAPTQQAIASAPQQAPKAPTPYGGGSQAGYAHPAFDDSTPF